MKKKITDFELGCNDAQLKIYKRIMRVGLKNCLLEAKASILDDNNFPPENRSAFYEGFMAVMHEFVKRHSNDNPKEN